MRIAVIGFIAMSTIAPCLCFVAGGQTKGAPSTATKPPTTVEAMRRQADNNARALANAVQAHAVKAGAYNDVLSDYAKDLGGTLPVNPCTGTRTGYTMTISNKGKSSIVSASAGLKCGKWIPKLFKLSL